ncbi:PE domain-containing protein [Saccharopolyspora spinosa]|uniref:PE family protein n=1 Tax=Saccharopolyspora spinosa TaxID=60894 RepID=A0A2N3Y6C8_SACSN|nr:PE domain-containing protein [Saccharopolyspora spinosa]PKW18479.1 PE family protein [Saccharopolyspora spinosa]
MTAPNDPTTQARIARPVALNPVTGMFQIPLIMVSSAEAAASSFEVAPEDLNAVKADLDAALDELQLASDDAQQFRSIPPPGKDEVSVDTTNKIIEHLTAGPGSAVQTIDEMRRWVKDFRDKIEAAQREYERIDDKNQIGKL